MMRHNIASLRLQRCITTTTTAWRSSLFSHCRNTISIRTRSSSAKVVVDDNADNSNKTLLKNNDEVDGDNAGSILFLSPSNWPEPNATAAGTRTMSLLQHFSARYSVHFGCGAKVPKSLTDNHNDDDVPLSSTTITTTVGNNNNNNNNNSSMIHWHQIKPNRSEEMKNLLQSINDNHGQIRAVVFDRFYAEEAFSFRIRELCPQALLVLDMQDVHSLRLGRQCLVEEMDIQCQEDAIDGMNDNDSRRSRVGSSSSIMMTKQLMQNVMEFDPTVSSPNNSSNSPLSNSSGSKKQKKAHDTFLRELASVHRSDLVLVCSQVEMKLLESSWNVPKWKLIPASFFCTDIEEDEEFNLEEKDNIMAPSSEATATATSSSKSFSFEDRIDFVSVGGFKHAPNVDSVKLLRYTIWPKIRAQLPNAKIHIYGAYPTSQILSMHDEASGFIVHGQVDDLDEVLLECRVLLAPLRFGAGCKGKIVDAWRCGCPVVTTPVGAEGMTDYITQDSCTADTAIAASWGGIVASDSHDFVQAAVKMYTQKDIWSTRRDKGVGLLNQLFNGRINLPVVENGVCDSITSLRRRRQRDIVGSILWRDAHRSTEYFSKWIEMKESIENEGAKKG